MRVLGIDPGSRITGWGLIEGPAGRPRVVESGVIRLGNGDLGQRLARLTRELEATVLQLEPETAAVEAPFHGVNARSALQLAHARGAILATLALREIPIAEYSPATVKKSVTGSGRADKDQVAGMVRALLDLGTRPLVADVTDALAVALCHANCVVYEARARSTMVTGGRR